MPLYFTIPIEDDDEIEIEISDDGALIFLDYDIDTDIIAAELAAEPSEAMEILLDWELNPISCLFYMHALNADSGIELRNVFIKTGERWIISACEFLHKFSCVSDDFLEKITRDIFGENLRDAIRSSRKYYSSIGEAINSLLRLTQLGNAHRSYYMNDLMTIHTQIDHAISWCDIDTKSRLEFEKNRLTSAINIIQEERTNAQTDDTL